MILPDWWDDECSSDPTLLPDLEIRVARFLGRSIGDIRDSSKGFELPAIAGVKLRQQRKVDQEKLTPAIFSALQVAAAVVRSMKASETPVQHIPQGGLQWRQQLAQPGQPVRLVDVIRDLWARGIPVVPLETLPQPGFQGLSCIVKGRPVIMLGYRYDEPGRVAFVVAHEAGHIAAGDCSLEHPVVDVDENIIDHSPMEREADLFALNVMVGLGTMPEIDGNDYRDLARKAVSVARVTGIDPSALIYAWGRRNGDYVTVTMAIRAIYEHTGARRLLRACFDQFIDVDGASESDRLLMNAIYRPAQDYAPAD